MDDWGTKMLATVSTVAEVVACGLGLPADAFTSRMHMGPHLLAPTGEGVHWIYRTCYVCGAYAASPERSKLLLASCALTCMQALIWGRMAHSAAAMLGTTTTSTS